MANPQVEDGFTRLANELLEALIQADLSARELRVLLAVARETYGWSRKATTVTGYKVAKMTGMQRTQAARALRALKQRNVLSNGNEGIGLQKDYQAWLPRMGSKSDPVRIRPGSNSDLRIGYKSDPILGSKSDPPIKKERNKERSTEALASAPHRLLMQEYHRLFTQKFGSPPDIVGGRDGKIIHDLLATRPVEEVLVLLRGFFQVGTRLSREAGRWDLPAFKMCFNDLLVMKSRGEL